MTGPRSFSLRSQLVLVLVVGAVLPLGLVGLWLVSSATRSGEELLQARLEETLGDIIQEIGRRWVGKRSDLLEIADHPAVQRMLGDDAGSATLTDEDLDALRAVYSAYEQDFARVIVSDEAGEIRWTQTPDPGSPSYGSRIVSSVFPVELGIYERLTGRRLGMIQADLRLTSLLPNGAEWAGVGGSVLGVFGSSGASLLPVSIDPTTFRQSRFEWDGQPWVGVRRVLSEPRLELVLATPLGPIEQPVLEAARRGTWALILVAAASLALVVGVTTRITRSLERLATASDAVSAGDLDRTVPEDGADEVARVARAFNSMTENLRTTMQRLSERESLAAVGEFAASLAHEVRNPLSSIQVDLQRVEEELTESAARDLARRALRSIERLNSTVTGALQVARSGRVTREPLDLRPVLEAATRAAAVEYRRRGVRLEASGDHTRPVFVRGDAAALEQVFLNLLLNAAQAQEEGGEAGLVARTEDGHAVVSVWDRGSGMSVEDRERAFEPFYSTREDGTGLGLAVVDRIVAAHGGTVVIESSDKPGTTITVRLPLM